MPFRIKYKLRIQTLAALRKGAGQIPAPFFYSAIPTFSLRPLPPLPASESDRVSDSITRPGVPPAVPTLLFQVALLCSQPYAGTGLSLEACYTMLFFRRPFDSVRIQWNNSNSSASPARASAFAKPTAKDTAKAACAVETKGCIG